MRTQRIKSINKRCLPLLILIVCAMAFCPNLVFAGASISVTGSPWAIGTKGASVGTTSSVFTVTNDNSDGDQDIDISVGSSADWSPSADSSPGVNEFVLQLDDSIGAVINASYTRLVDDLANNQDSDFTLYLTTPSSGVETEQTMTVNLTATNWAWNNPGSNYVVNHTTAGGVAPVDKEVTYGTVLTSLSGASKCWITQNLGASQQATSATDDTEPSAGWYWQFNRKQGYYQPNANGALISTATPDTWDSTNDNTYTGWDPAKDPCTLLLGTGWRLPTNTEWTNADSTGGWVDYADDATGTFGSVLKLHAAGHLGFSTGALDNRGGGGGYWSSTQGSSTNGYSLYFGSSSSLMYNNGKAYGFSVRCLKD